MIPRRNRLSTPIFLICVNIEIILVKWRVNMKKVAVIQDMSSFGKCSLTAAMPVLSVMGIQACPLPTAVLTAQTAYPSFYCKDLTEEMNHFTAQWSKMLLMGFKRALLQENNK